MLGIEANMPVGPVLIVEDDPAMMVALRDILASAGFNVRTAANGKAALEVMAEERPSLILSDIMMPVMDGHELFSAVRKLPGGLGIPFIFLTAKGNRREVFTGNWAMGADDYIKKPISGRELIAAVRSRLRRADEMMVVQLKHAYKASLRALANAIEARDPYTRNHVDRVNAFAQALAVELGWDADHRDALEFGAILHDIGKIQVDLPILRKTVPLAAHEWETMRQHPVHGAKMIDDIPYLAPAIPMVLHHHERWDGTGYPDKLSGLSIPEEARLLAVVDAFDAMTSDRPYRAAIEVDTAYGLILSEAAKQFDPVMVKAFKCCWDRNELQPIISSNHRRDDPPSS
jgi:putative two-component system response regulator